MAGALKKHVTTDLRTSVAKQFTTKVTSGEVTIKINIAPQNLVDNYKFMIDSETYLGISIIEQDLPNRKLVFLVSKQPFIYF